MFCSRERLLLRLTHITSDVLRVTARMFESSSAATYLNPYAPDGFVIPRNVIRPSETNVIEISSSHVGPRMDQQAAFLELLNANHGRWRAIARSYAGPDAEDLFQEILLQIWRSLQTFQGRSVVGTWCYRVALNTALSWRRSERVRRERLPIRDGYNPVLVRSPTEHPWSSGILRQLSADLTPADRAVLLLYLDDVGYADMAEILGASEGSLRVRLHRIKKRLVELYQGECDES